MDNTVWNESNTTLDLNGPILSFSEQPTGATGIGTTLGATGGASVSFTGIASGVPSGTGYLSYQWYEVDVGKLSDDTYITGTASTGPVGTAATLTVSNLVTPRDNQRKFYLEADYVASAYGVGKSTGNAWNEPLSSGIATVTVNPLLEIVAQPTSQQTLINSTTNEFVTGKTISLNVNADLSDSYFGDDLVYQWYVDGQLATDGVSLKTVTTSDAVPGEIENTYTSPASLTLLSSSTDITVTLAGGRGGKGGNDRGGAGGSGGKGRAGRFNLVDGAKQFLIWVGSRGNDGTSGEGSAYGSGGDNGVANNLGDGGRGGGAGQRGWSGGGGGGGAASIIQNDGDTILVAAGGGGGGGGVLYRGGEKGNDGSPFSGDLAELSAGKQGDNRGSSYDGSGGGGGGGGAPGGDGGLAGRDIRYGGTGGGGGVSARSANPITNPAGSTWLNNNDGYVTVKYTGYTAGEQTVDRKTSISGSGEATLKLACDTVGVQTCQCKITSATSSNSPMWSDEVNAVFVSTVAQNNINVEAIGVGITAELASINLTNGDFIFDTTQADVDSGQITKYHSFYSPDKDLDVEMDLYGGKGNDKGSYTGGEGGYSRIRFTMTQNTEYVIVGLSSDLNAPFLYRKGELISCVGQGGDASISGNGGSGGGVSNEGQNGGGRESGVGGLAIASGTMGANGIFGSKYTASQVYVGDSQATGQDAGKTIRCTKGVYWADRGIAPCSDITGEIYGGDTVQFRLDGGSIVENTASITRGFKAGYNIIETAGAKEANGGIGGNGATGGSGGLQGGGGGGSGYNDGSVTIIDTQQGGSTTNAKVIMRLQS